MARTPESRPDRLIREADQSQIRVLCTVPRLQFFEFLGEALLALFALFASHIDDDDSECGVRSALLEFG